MRHRSRRTETVGRRRLTPLGAVLLVAFVVLLALALLDSSRGAIIGLIVVVLFTAWGFTAGYPSGQGSGAVGRYLADRSDDTDFGAQAEREHDRTRKSD
jgi:hypothetical protein